MPKHSKAFVDALAAEVEQHGKELFFSALASCTALHKVGNMGSDVGPNLAIVGAGRIARFGKVT